MQRPGNETMAKTQGAMYGTEHMLAWLMALIALVLGVLGLLTGVNIIDWRSGTTDFTGDQGATVLPSFFWDGTMIIFSGITSAILAYTLHASQHHRMRSLNAMPSSDRAMSGFEHGLAYLFVLASIVLLVIGLLTGFGLFGVDNDQLYGLAWIWTGFGSGILGAALHEVQHHQAVETDELVAIVVDRVSGRGPVTGPTTTTNPSDLR